MRTSFFTTISRVLFLADSKNISRLTLLCGAVSLLSLSSCNYSVAKKANGAAANNQTGLPTQNNGEPVFIDAALVQKSVLNSCVDCHGSGGKNPELSTVADLRSNVADAIGETDANSMPPSKRGYAHLTDCQKAILHKWSDLGTPTTSAVEITTLPACATALPAPSAPAPAPAPAPHPPVASPLPPSPSVPTSILNMPVNYQTFLTQILQPKCVTCHDANSGDPDAGDILFVPFAQITTKAKLFAGPSGTSRFLKLVTRTDGKQMPPVSSNMPHLNAEELAFVAKWIDAGTPEN